MEYGSLVLASGATGYWPLGETSGSSAMDRTTTANTGTYTATALAALPAPGGNGRSPYMNASPSYADMASNSGYSGGGASGVVTVECWARPFAGTGSFQAYVSKFGIGSGCEYTMGVLSTGEAFWQPTTFNGGANSTATAPSALQSLVWHHLVGTWDKANNVQNLYIDGRLIVTTTCAITMTADVGHFRVGYRADASGAANAQICQVAVYQKVLNSGRIQLHYRAGIPSSRRDRPIAA